MVFQQKPLEKADFMVKMTGSAMMLGVSKSMYFRPNKNNNVNDI